MSGAGPLAGQLALVTGASRGIGRAIAARLAADGAVVVGTSRSADGAGEIDRQLGASGGFGFVFDACDVEALPGALRDIEQRAGAVPSILVNNAGITRDTLLSRMGEAAWHEVFETNLHAAYRLCRVVTRRMLHRRCGRIVNISSVVASAGNPGQSNYAASKAGLEGFSRALALELGPRGITVNSVAPGYIDTDMTRAMPVAAAAALRERIPLRRLGEPEDVAAVVAFLVGPGGAYITGATLHVNGGLYL